jgi:hypothetical protein
LIDIRMTQLATPRFSWSGALACAVVTAACALHGPAAQASPATITFDDAAITSSSPFNIKFQGDLLGEEGPMTVAARWVGQFEMHTTEGASFMAWCVDLFHTININSITAKKPLTYSVANLSTDSSGRTQALSNSLSAQQVHNVLALANYGNQQLAGMAAGYERNILSGAVQVAIWDTLYEGQLTYQAQGKTTNGFTSSDFVDLVEDLQGLAPSLGTGNVVALLNLDNFGVMKTQGLVGGTPNMQTNMNQSQVSPVPEPSNLALLSLGLVLSAAAARKRRSA